MEIEGLFLEADCNARKKEIHAKRQQVEQLAMAGPTHLAPGGNIAQGGGAM